MKGSNDLVPFIGFEIVELKANDSAHAWTKQRCWENWGWPRSKKLNCKITASARRDALAQSMVCDREIHVNKIALIGQAFKKKKKSSEWDLDDWS